MHTVQMVHFKYSDNVRSMHSLDSAIHNEPVVIKLQGATFTAKHEGSGIVVRNNNNVVVYNTPDSGKNVYRNAIGLHEESIVETFANYYGES